MDLHALDPEVFEAEVRTFEHWFGSVEDYLSGLEHGHRPELAGGPASESERERLVTTLCTYAVAERAALEASSGLVRIAPNRATQVFLSTQVADEGRHLEVMHQRLRELGVADPEAEVEQRATRSIRDFRDHLLQLVDAREWDAALFAQNIALENMEFTVFRAHADVADPVTRDLLERVLRDERRHIGFGEGEIGRRLGRDPKARRSLGAVKAEIDARVLETFEETMQELGIPRDERPGLGRSYLAAVDRLGIA